VSSAQRIIISSFPPTHLPTYQLTYLYPTYLRTDYAPRRRPSITYRRRVRQHPDRSRYIPLYRAAAAEVRVNVAQHASETEKPARARYNVIIMP